jgi:hypothetical protein
MTRSVGFSLQSLQAPALSRSDEPLIFMSGILRIVAATLMLMLSTLVANAADTNAFQTSIKAGVDAPITITACIAANVTVNAYGVLHFARGHQVVTGTGLAVAFKVAASKTVTAVRFQFDFSDAFGSPIQTALDEDRQGLFPPGILIAPEHKKLLGILPQWEINALPSGTSVTCSVEKVLFSDGTTWSPPPISYEDRRPDNSTSA